jgi:hypothetical protein
MVVPKYKHRTTTTGDVVVCCEDWKQNKSGISSISRFIRCLSIDTNAKHTTNPSKPKHTTTTTTPPPHSGCVYDFYDLSRPLVPSESYKFLQVPAFPLAQLLFIQVKELAIYIYI